MARATTTRKATPERDPQRKAKATAKTVPTAVPVASYIAALESTIRRDEAAVIDAMMEEVTGEAPRMWGPSIIGFGSYHYVYDSGREGDMPLTGFSPRKAALVIYIMTGFTGAGAMLARLGKHTTGKSCLYIKRLSDVDRTVLKELVVESVAAMRKKYPR